MKNLSLFILFITLATTFGCEDILEEKIYGQIANADFWKTEQDAEAAIKGAYAASAWGWRGISFWPYVIEDMGTDISTGGYFATSLYSAYTAWSGTTPDFITWGIWPPVWQSINYANTVLDNVPDMDIDVQVKNRVIGEAHAIRAMVYFYLVNWFGGMPEVTTAKEIPKEIPRQSVESNFKLIEDDLKAAMALLPVKSNLVSMGEKDYGRVSKHAALSLLARTYLQQGKWQECADATLEVISSGEYALEPVYINIFTLENEGFRNREVIWVLPFVAGTSPLVPGCPLQPYIWKASEIPDYSNYYDWDRDIRVTLSFYNSFESGDKRREGLFSSTDEITDPIMLIKYPADPATDGRYSGTDFPVVRYADILLMRAEALAQLGDLAGAVQEINKVRARAGLQSLDPDNYTSASLLMHILNERRWEFYFEGHAKRDMIRLDYDRMIAYIKSQSDDWETVTAERYLLLPLPSIALAANPGLTQNPGF
jgi:hypothetical protein